MSLAATRGSTEGPTAIPVQPGLRPLSPLAFAAVAVASVGGPLALAALYAPAAVSDVTTSAGFVTIAAPIAFVLPLLIWLHYSRHIASPGGLFAFVDAAAGRRLALAQAGFWTLSYVLYLTYTTAYVVYDVLPVVTPSVRSMRPALELVLPVAIAAVMLAGRRTTIAVIAVIAAGQLVLVGLLDVVAVRHATPAAALAPHGDVGGLGRAGGSVALLFICASLPLFLGGEVARPRRTIPTVLPAAIGVTAIGVVVAVLPLALDPAFAHAEIPGMSLVGVDVSHAAGVAIGVGVAASVVGVMIVEYLAATRLLHAVTGRSVRRLTGWLAVPLIVAAPISLLDPSHFYADLLKPSLIALWLSQLLVVAVYPLFVAKHQRLRAYHVLLGAGASAVMIYGLWTSITSVGGT